MSDFRRFSWIVSCTVVSIAFLCAAFGRAGAQDKALGKVSGAGVRGSHRTFHGWDALVLRSSVAEVVVVPAIGRVMEFNLLNDKGAVADGPFWSNPKIGAGLKPDREGWTNFGGDKAWPAPQSEWPKITGSGWPPPRTFDAAPYTGTVRGSTIELLSAVDPSYGVRIRRTISLSPSRPVLTIETRYEKVRGSPVRIAIWTITQVRPPDRAVLLLPRHSTFAEGYVSALPGIPKDLRVEGRLLSLSRNPEVNTMIDSDADAVLWVGDGPDLLIANHDTASTDSAPEWPNHGTHMQIYTNGGMELPYIECELMGPLHTLKSGQSSVMKSTYTLLPRTESDPLAKARKVFAEK